jgi:hypothetical protein
LSSKLVAFSQRQVERLGEPDHYFPARHRSPASDKAEVPLCRTGQRSQFQLAEPTVGAALAKGRSEVHSTRF